MLTDLMTERLIGVNRYKETTSDGTISDRTTAAFRTLTEGEVLMVVPEVDREEGAGNASCATKEDTSSTTALSTL